MLTSLLCPIPVVFVTPASGPLLIGAAYFVTICDYAPQSVAVSWSGLANPCQAWEPIANARTLICNNSAQHCP